MVETKVQGWAVGGSPAGRVRTPIAQYLNEGLDEAQNDWKESGHD